MRRLYFIFSFTAVLALSACSSQELASDLSGVDGSAKDDDGVDKEIEAECSSTSIKSITDMPFDHTKADGAKFTYRYQHVVKSSEWTILVLPGGPGQALIGSNFMDEMDYNFVYIDPRGVGCNYPGTESIDESLLTTEQHAKDIVRVIETMKLQKYVIYGASYGTVIATVVAKAAEGSAYKPHAVVLEGVLGKALGGDIKLPNCWGLMCCCVS